MKLELKYPSELDKDQMNRDFISIDVSDGVSYYGIMYQVIHKLVEQQNLSEEECIEEFWNMLDLERKKIYNNKKVDGED